MYILCRKKGNCSFTVCTMYCTCHIKKPHQHIFPGLAQCAELVKQLRGLADKRQVDGAKIAMQHNFGIGGAAVVTMYKKYQPLPVHAKL